MYHAENINKTNELVQAKRGLVVIFEFFIRNVSILEYCKSFYLFCANTSEKMLQSFAVTYEPHVEHSQLWRHLSRYLRRLLALH